MYVRRSVVVAVGAAVGLFVLVQLGALALVGPFKAAGFQSVENPQNPTNSLLYVALLLVATGAMLLILRYGGQWLLRAFIVFTSGLISWYVFSVLLAPVAVVVGGVNVLALGAAAVVALALYTYPEWYVIDAAGVVMGAGAAALFGVNFGVFPAIVLLVILAVYDAISVYGTEHMLTLASGVMEMKVPVILIIPLSFGYSFLDETPEMGADGVESNAGIDSDESADHATQAPGPFEREAFFIGLGDAVMPTILVVSAAPAVGQPIAMSLPVLTGMLGTLLGLLVLLWLVMKGRAHAGLPLLNGGAILGYLVGALASGVPLLEALGIAHYL